MAKRKYTECFISPEIKKVGDLETLQFRSKDSRGYDFGIQLSAVEPDSTAREIPEVVNADRVATFFGGSAETIGDLGTEIKITLGAKGETHIIYSPSMVYIPKGQPYKEALLSHPDKRSWELNISLPPKYEEQQ
jgi:hypothetical protein